MIGDNKIGDNKRRPNMISDTTQKLCHPDRSGAKASGVEGPAFFHSAWSSSLPSAQRLASFCLFALLAFSAACNRGTSQPGTLNPQSAAKRYPLKGKVISIDKQAGTANINNEPIPGFMDPMVMPYTVKPPAALDQLQLADSITADVVVEPGKYWLENVKVTGHSKTAAAR
jgi:Cu/Ag efflux protein CusF